MLDWEAHESEMRWEMRYELIDHFAFQTNESEEPRLVMSVLSAWAAGFKGLCIPAALSIIFERHI